MAVKLVSTFVQYVGTSADVKPNIGMILDGETITRSVLHPGSQFLETDTGVFWWYDGSNWQRVPTDGVQTVVAFGLLLEAIRGVHRTLEQLRLGMINKDTCDNVDDVDGILAELVS